MALRLSQEDLGDRLGVHRSHVGSIERGNENVSLQKVERLAESLGVDPMVLFGPIGDAPHGQEKYRPEPNLLHGPRRARGQSGGA